MKKSFQLALIFTAIAFTSASAQEKIEEQENQVSKGKWFVETSTSLNADTKPGTTIYFEGTNNFNLGLEGGYFVMKNLALKGGFGYGEREVLSTFSYKIGAKYYLLGRIPLGLDFSGSINKYDSNVIFPTDFNEESLGLSAGYAFFVGKFLSIEPSLNMSYDFNSSGNNNIDSFAKIGFSIHF